MASEVSDVEKKIIRQVEYYFGDCNLPRDRFLQEQIKGDNGWVTLETMLCFNRLKQLSKEEEVVAAALRKSTLGLIEVSEDGTKIRRSPDKPLPDNDEEYKKQVAARTIYAKAFPLDTHLDVLQDFFETFGETESVVRRKDQRKNFKGSVFVTFRNEESAKKFLEAESVKFNETELEKRLLKNDYFQQKEEERKKLQAEKQKKKDEATIRQRQDEIKKAQNEMPKGAILNLKGIKDGTSREEIKVMLLDYGPIAWIDFNKGDPECFVRYDQENKATQVLERVKAVMKGEIKLNGAVLESRVLEGEEEAEKWKKMYEDSINRHNKNKNKMSKNKMKGRYGKRPSKAERMAMKAKREAEMAARAGGADKGGDEKAGGDKGGDDNSGEDQTGDDKSGDDKAGDEGAGAAGSADDEEPPVKKAKVEVEANGD